MVWEAETGQLVAGMTGHANPVLDLGFSADGGLLVSAGRDEQARVWETATGRLVGEYAGHTGDVTSVRFLGGGQRVVSGGADGTVKVWDAASGELTANWIAGDDGITGIAVSPDGELIAVAAGDAPIKTWAAASGQLIAEHLGHRETILAVSLTADGTLAAHTVSALYTAPVQAAQLAQIEAERVIRVWDAATAQPVVDCGGYPGRPIGILFSQDGRSLVSVSDEGAVSVWSLPAGQLIGECQDVHGQVTAAAVAPDGGLVAAGTGDGAVLTWRVPPGRLAGDCQGLGGQVTEVAVSPDGERVAAGNDRGQIMIWDARTGQEVCRCAGHEGAVAGLSFAPDGQVLASGGEERTVREWRSDTGELVTEWRHRDIGQIQSVDFGADGITVRCSLATVGQFLSHSVVLSGERHNLTVETRMMNPPGHAATSPDGRLRAASDRLLVFWADRQAARLAVGDDRASDIAAVAFSADGQRVAWGMREVTVQERATGREFPRCTGHKYDVTAIAFAPDGCTLASGGRDNTVKVWDVETGVCTADLTGLGGEPTAVAFSPDGQKLAVATLRGGVSAWDLTGQDGDAQAGEAETARDVAAGAQTAAGTARLLFEDTKTLSYVSDIGFAPSGKLVIASGPTVLGWNVETGQVMGRLPGGEEGEPAFRTVALLIGLLTVSVRTVDLSPLRQPAAPGGEGGEP
jgi:WD40 repeat protein